MKYIIVNNLDMYLFPRSISHDTHRDRVARPGDRVTGAGFVRLADTGPECYGESESLGVGRGLVDDKLVRIMLTNN